MTSGTDDPDDDGPSNNQSDRASEDQPEVDRADSAETEGATDSDAEAADALDDIDGPPESKTTAAEQAGSADDHPTDAAEQTPAEADMTEDMREAEAAEEPAAEADTDSTSDAEATDPESESEPSADSEVTAVDSQDTESGSGEKTSASDDDASSVDADAAEEGDGKEEPATEADTDDEGTGADHRSETAKTEEPDAADDGGDDTMAGRDPADLTPDEVEVTRPDEFEFRYLPKDRLPPDLQYTPEFDPDWVYPSGTKDGGTQDDVPVQGLETGVLATEDTLEAIVEAVLEALELYHDAVGEYPRHRIVDSAATFRDLNDGSVGLAVVFQPRPDDYDGLTDHMTALTAGDSGAVDGNYDRARRLVQYLVGSLTHRELAALPGAEDVELEAVTDWESPRRVGTTPIVERYGPLAAEEVYDPTAGPVDISTDGVASVTETNISPTYLDINHVEELF